MPEILIREARLCDYPNGKYGANDEDNGIVVIPADGMLDGIPVTGLRYWIEFLDPAQVVAEENLHTLSIQLKFGTQGAAISRAGGNVASPASGWYSHPGNNYEGANRTTSTYLNTSNRFNGRHVWLECVAGSQRVQEAGFAPLKYKAWLEILGGEVEM